MNLLIVDDDSHIRRLLRIYLRDEGFELFEAATGEEAMALFEGRPFDLVLLDLILPFYGGFRLCQKFKAQATGLKPHVIVITGDDSAETRESTAQSGADDFIAKPFTREEILELVRKVAAARR